MCAKSLSNITVYRGFPIANAHVWSPFVAKLEARLRFANLRYQIKQGSPRSGPRTKIPYVDISYEGEDTTTTMSDTVLISRRLVEDGVCKDLNTSLSQADKARDAAIRGLMEDKLYWYQGYERWHQNYYTMRDGVLAAIPYPVRLVVGVLAYRGMMSTLHGQGTARFTSEEIAAFRDEIWEDIAALAAEARRTATNTQDPFWILGGGQPTDADTTVFGFIASGLVCSAAPDTGRAVRSHPVLVDYATRIHNEYFSDYEKWDVIGE